MKKLAVLLSLAPTLALAAGSTWNVDATHSQVGFAVRHLVISNVRGEFGAYQGKLVLDDADVTRSTVEATIDVNSVNTKVADRDAHLKSPDFFDVECGLPPGIGAGRIGFTLGSDASTMGAPGRLVEKSGIA